MFYLICLNQSVKMSLCGLMVGCVRSYFLAGCSDFLESYHHREVARQPTLTFNRRQSEKKFMVTYLDI